MSGEPAPDLDGLDVIRAKHGAAKWKFAVTPSGSYTACRDWYGNQQKIEVASLGELDFILSRLPV